MQCPHCAHPDYILFGKNRGAQRYHCQACRRTFQTLCRGKDLALKEQAQKLYLEGLGLRAIGRILGVHHKTLLLAAASCPSTPSEPTADRGLLLHRSRSALSSLKKVPMLALASGRLHLWQGPKALSVEGGRSQPVRSFGSRSSICRRWAMARTC